MANRTVKDAHSIHGTNPQYLVEKIIRTRIYDSRYWKEECFALSAELLVDKAMDLRSIGGVYGGNIKPTPFLCLVLKMLQIQPEKDIIVEFIKQDEFKYVRALGAFYLRLVYGSLDCYKYLEPLLNDYRKLRIMDRSGKYQLSHVDEFIDILLRDERFCDIIMPRIQKRWVHEANNELEGRVSLLDDDLDDLESESDDEELLPPPRPRSNPPENTRTTSRDDRHGRGHSPSRRSPQRDQRGDRDRDKRQRSRSRSRERDRGLDRNRGMDRDRGMDYGRGGMDHGRGGMDRDRGMDHGRGGMERDRGMDRDRGGMERERGGMDRDRKRHRSRSRDRRHRSRSPGHHHHRERGGRGGDKDRDHRHERDGKDRAGRDRDHRDRKDRHHRTNTSGRSSKRDSGAGGMSREEMEIAEANALRARLGMAPLQP
ncbi:hypothetical protein Pcinc_002656 [Petrolisthes cinctipes]|uniref:Pre-mRNA-splicing factor 38 n=1 Tax=Petrolisthes cinctipes TaxID=88211 RepID=A0AAE1GKI5_PETCI|nr:hypothetical protein Pcinc_002656 [Petrolisthes cinctipes]